LTHFVGCFIIRKNNESARVMAIQRLGAVHFLFKLVVGSVVYVGCGRRAEQTGIKKLTFVKSFA